MGSTDGIRDCRVFVDAQVGDVSAKLLRPEDCSALLLLAHGAGAGMEHPFMNGVCRALAERRIGSLRYQFAFMDRGRRRPDSKPVLQSTVRAAVRAARDLAPDLPLVAGGKSMGGRMTSIAEAEAPLGVRGLVFLGFPLHPAGRPSIERAAHLGRVPVPMLFVQGTRDALADLALLRPVCSGLSRATIHIVEGADHSFHVLKRSGRSDAAAFEEVVSATADWVLARTASA